MEPIQHLLLSVPIEVLSCITGKLNSREIAKLWNCGSKQLHEAFGRRGGVKALMHNGDPLYVPRWPSLLCHLPNLSEMCIIDDKLVNGPHLIHATPKLRTMTLCFESALVSFLNAIAPNTPHFSNLESLCIEDTSNLSVNETLCRLKTISSLTDLDLAILSYTGSILEFLPPKLLSLSFTANIISVIDFNVPRSLEKLIIALASSPKVGDLADLPSGLLSFCFASEDYTMTLDHIATLPRGLTRLETELQFSDWKNLLAVIPPFLQEYRLFGANKHIPKEHFNLLPRSLTDTNILGNVTAESVKQLPPNISYISINSDAPSLLSNLPSKLKTLDRRLETPLEIPEDFNGRIALPCTLTRLTNFPVTILDYCTLPEGMLSISFLSTDVLTAAHARLLPRSLTRLMISEFEPEGLVYLPRPLRFAYLGAPGSTVGLTAVMIGNIPRSLKSLSLRVASIEAAAFEVMPTDLHDLTIHADTLDLGALGKLNTPNLRVLYIYLQLDAPGLLDDFLATIPRAVRLFRCNMREMQFEVTSFDKIPAGLVTLSIPPDLSDKSRALPKLPTHAHPDLVINGGQIVLERVPRQKA